MHAEDLRKMKQETEAKDSFVVIDVPFFFSTDTDSSKNGMNCIEQLNMYASFQA